MEGNWKPSLTAVLQSEGGNVDDPDDHGGRTSRGITQREYNAWRKLRGQPMLDVWKAPQEDVENIYHQEYWEPYCDILPIGADYMLFDMAVNAGPHWGAVLLQRALGITADGRIGPITRVAINRATSTGLVLEYTKQKIDYYKSLHQPKWLRGWLNRAEFVKNTALRMIAKGMGNDKSIG